MPELFESRYFSGQGAVFIAERDAAGQPVGLEFLGDISSASLTPVIEKESVTENVTGSSGIGAEFTTKTEYTFAMQMRSIKPTHLAFALQANKTVKAGGSVTDESHKAYKGKFINLKHTKVSTVVITHSSGSPTYVAGTDYIVHGDKGMIEILSTSVAITEAQVVLIDYAYASQHHISAAPSNKKYYLVFAGINRADNSKQTRCEIYSLSLSPSALGFIEQGTAEMPITGTVITDALRPAGDQFFSWKTED